MRVAAAAAMIAAAEAAACRAAAETPAPGLASLTGRPGDAARGRVIVLARERGNCTICHAVPAPDERFHGDLAPGLRGVADRLGENEIRLRVVDGRRLNPDTIMPSYHRVDGLRRVGAAYAGKPLLSAEEIEDVVAYLLTLRDAPPAGERR